MEIRPLLSALWRNRTGPLLVATQVAITLMVMVNVAYVVEQRFEMNRRPTGIDIENIFSIVSEGYDANYNHAVAVETDLKYLNSLPGVVAASISNAKPQVFDRLVLPFSTERDGKGRQEFVIVLAMSARSVETLGLRLIAGTSFAAESVAPPGANGNETIGNWAPEIVITKALAEKLFPDGHAVGKTVYVGIINRQSRIAGVVEYMQASPISGPNAAMAERVALVPIIYAGPRALYLVRTYPGKRDSVMARVDQDFEGIQHGRFIDQLETLEKTASRTRAPMQASVIILMIVALLVLIVTAIGLFGLAAFSVTTRTKQIGTRRAIGARRFHIIRYFIVENWLITSFGVVVGCILALAAGVKISLMFQLPRLPLIYLVGGVIGLWIIGLLATVLPANRAAAISPAIATRVV